MPDAEASSVYYAGAAENYRRVRRLAWFSSCDRPGTVWHQTYRE